MVNMLNKLELEARLTSMTIETLNVIHNSKKGEVSDESAERFMSHLFQLGLLGKALDSLEEKTGDELAIHNRKLPSWFGWASKIQSTGEAYITESPIERDGLYDEIDLTIGHAGLLGIVDGTVGERIRISGIPEDKLAIAVVGNEISFINPVDASKTA